MSPPSKPPTPAYICVQSVTRDNCSLSSVPTLISVLCALATIIIPTFCFFCLCLCLLVTDLFCTSSFHSQFTLFCVSVFLCFVCLLIANPLVCLVRSFPLNPSPPLCSCSLLCALHPDEFSISTLSMEPGSVMHHSSEIWNQQKRRPIGKLTPPIQSEVQGPLLYFGPRRIIKMKFSFIQFWFKGELPSN